MLHNLTLFHPGCFVPRSTSGLQPPPPPRCICAKQDKLEASNVA